MNRYRISNSTSGHVFGVYEGADADAALDAMARDAGYASHRDAIDTWDTNDFSDGVQVELVEEDVDLAAEAARLRQVNAELLAALRAAEYQMSKCPDFNAWDLGPSETLKRIRATLDKAEGRA